MGIITICEDGTLASAGINKENARKFQKLLMQVQAQLMQVEEIEEGSKEETEVELENE